MIRRWRLAGVLGAALLLIDGAVIAAWRVSPWVHERVVTDSLRPLSGKRCRFPGYHVTSTVSSAATRRRNGARTWTTR